MDPCGRGCTTACQPKHPAAGAARTKPGARLKAELNSPSWPLRRGFPVRMDAENQQNDGFLLRMAAEEERFTQLSNVFPRNELIAMKLNSQAPPTAQKTLANKYTFLEMLPS